MSNKACYCPARAAQWHHASPPSPTLAIGTVAVSRSRSARASDTAASGSAYGDDVAVSGIRMNLRGAFFSSWIAGNTRSVSGTSSIVAPSFSLWDLTATKPLWWTVEAFAVVDNLMNIQDSNTALVSATGSALPIYRSEIGRTWRGGLPLELGQVSESTWRG